MLRLKLLSTFLLLLAISLVLAHRQDLYEARHKKSSHYAINSSKPNLVVWLENVLDSVSVNLDSSVNGAIDFIAKPPEWLVIKIKSVLGIVLTSVGKAIESLVGKAVKLQHCIDDNIIDLPKQLVKDLAKCGTGSSDEFIKIVDKFLDDFGDWWNHIKGIFGGLKKCHGISKCTSVVFKQFGKVLKADLHKLFDVLSAILLLISNAITVPLCAVKVLTVYPLVDLYGFGKDLAICTM